ncbi:MAG TPA: PqqD family protein [Patescibacteria group bacterium]|nr:PqqD family protein [Patescibacteria group bacterium]
MDLNTVLSKTPDAAYRVYDGLATIVLPSRSEVNVLNPVASLVWDAIDGRRTLAEILESVLRDYEVPREEATRDLLEFVNALRAQGMVN